MNTAEIIDFLESKNLDFELTEDDNTLVINITKDCQDEELKEEIELYKEGIELLSDDVFLELVEALKTKFDINEFNDLLKLDSFSCEQAEKVRSMIKVSYETAFNIMQDKVKNLVIFLSNL